MTTKLTITNDNASNGDVVVRFANVCSVDDPNRPGDGTNVVRLLPGDKPVSFGITDCSVITLHEEWPTAREKAPRS